VIDVVLFVLGVGSGAGGWLLGYHTGRRVGWREQDERERAREVGYEVRFEGGPMNGQRRVMVGRLPGLDVPTLRSPPAVSFGSTITHALFGMTRYRVDHAVYVPEVAP
jgi:hypothetical protein